MSDAEVTQWLVGRAVVLAAPRDTDPAGEHELEAWDPDPGDVLRVVGLGLAVAGTRELPRVAHRLLDHLVRGHGVRTLALQAGESETTLVDDHVRRGVGSAGDAVAGLGSWAWNTHEMLDLVRGLAEHNRTAETADQVAVVGVDPVRPAMSVRIVGAFLRVAAPDELAPVAEAFADLAVGRGGRASVPAVERVRSLFGRENAALIAATSPAQFGLALRHAAMLSRAAELAAAPKAQATAVASRMRAEALLAEADPEVGGVAFWGHADHVVVRDDPMTTGAHLRAQLGDGYYALALTAGAGRIRALRRRLLGVSRTPKVHRLPAPGRGTLEATLAAATPRDHLVDLRDDAAVPARVGAWLAAPTARRSVGDEVSASAPVTATVPCVPGSELDGVALVGTVAPAWAR